SILSRTRARCSSPASALRPARPRDDPMESTLLIIKPDAVRRGLTGEILARVERKGLRIEDVRLDRIDRALAERHYAEHQEKTFFGELVEFITSGDVVLAKVSGRDAV